MQLTLLKKSKCSLTAVQLMDNFQTQHSCKNKKNIKQLRCKNKSSIATKTIYKLLCNGRTDPLQDNWFSKNQLSNIAVLMSPERAKSGIDPPDQRLKNKKERN